MAKLPPQFDRVDNYGMAPIHLCAILDKLNDPEIQSVIAKNQPHNSIQVCMAHPTDGKKRDAIAQGVVNISKRRGDIPRSGANQIRGYIMGPVNLGIVDAWQLAVFFTSTPPNSCNAPPNTTSPSSIGLPAKDRQKAVFLYYLPVAFGRVLKFDANDGCKDPGEDSMGTLVEAYRIAIEQYDPAKGLSPVTLVSQVLKFKAIDLHNKIKKHRLQMDLAEEQLATIYERSPDPNAEVPGAESERAETENARNIALAAATASLKPRERKIFELYSSGIKQIEIAKTMDVAPSTINESIPKIKEKYRRSLKQFGVTEI